MHYAYIVHDVVQNLGSRYAVIQTLPRYAYCIAQKGYGEQLTLVVTLLILTGI
jgi:hypothetical protein